MARVEPQPDVDLSADSVCLVGLGGAVGMVQGDHPRPGGHQLAAQGPGGGGQAAALADARWRPTIVGGASRSRSRSRTVETSWGTRLRSCTRCSSATVVDPRSRRPEARRCAGTRRAPLRSAGRRCRRRGRCRSRGRRGAAGARPRRHRAASGCAATRCGPPARGRLPPACSRSGAADAVDLQPTAVLERLDRGPGRWPVAGAGSSTVTNPSASSLRRTSVTAGLRASAERQALASSRGPAPFTGTPTAPGAAGPWLRADQARLDLAVLEEDQRRDAHHVVAPRHVQVVVDVELADLELASCSVAISSSTGRSSCTGHTTPPRSRPAPVRLRP